MTDYIVTFHTHISALITYRNLKEAGIVGKMAPIPRALSSTCGTCLRYSAESYDISLFDKDFEALYEEYDNGEEYKFIISN